jgi:hypothetical protein
VPAFVLYSRSSVLVRAHIPPFTLAALTRIHVRSPAPIFAHVRVLTRQPDTSRRSCYLVPALIRTCQLLFMFAASLRAGLWLCLYHMQISIECIVYLAYLYAYIILYLKIISYNINHNHDLACIEMKAWVRAWMECGVWSVHVHWQWVEISPQVRSLTPWLFKLRFNTSTNVVFNPSHTIMPTVCQLSLS